MGNTSLWRSQLKVISFFVFLMNFKIDDSLILGATTFAKGGVGRHGKFVLDKFNNDIEVTV